VQPRRRHVWYGIDPMMGPADRFPDCFGSTFVVPIFRPFPNVTADIVHAPGFRLLLTYRVRLLTAVLLIPAHLIGIFQIGRRTSRPGSELPFRLRREPIKIAVPFHGHSSQEFLRVESAHVFDRSMRPLEDTG